MSTFSPAIVLLGQHGLATARQLQALYPQARVLGLAARVQGADEAFEHFGDTLRQLYRANTPIIALCAAGIVIRTLAAELLEKTAEPPVLALAEDGSAVVPLLGGLSGVNRMAREVGAHLQVAAAITTSGELRFGTCLLNPPEGYVLADVEQGKRFVSDLLGGEALRLDGAAPWLEAAGLPQAPGARLAVKVSAQAQGSADELLIHPRAVLVAVHAAGADLAQRIDQALAAAGYAKAALGCLLAPPAMMADSALHALAAQLGVPLRFNPVLPAATAPGLGLVLHGQPLQADAHGQRRGRLAVVGLGPGSVQLMAPAVRSELARAEDVLGYETYVRMAGPFRDDQVLHCTDNREELQRARHAFELAAQGRSVVVVSSGDPGVFAMASAVLEALDASQNEAWQRVDLQILPGISASLATAAWAGAPLGHDFCLISLSDNLKPWATIEQRLHLAGEADMAMAFYNPISRSRPWQLGRALEILREHRGPQTPVVLGRDVARPGQALRVVTLAELVPEMVDMRTMVIVGSSTTRCIPRPEGAPWVYTPRWYPAAPQ
ncbi:precorrin-3B C(17)-methyltransferase [Pseudomonas sp. NPDC007930]|uniref:precorrin-3B C(17)-methyltransferase n=1 Tax=Pseudomonas sp. NPDC007930 TaxID=3364417 RepID=UPI0036ED8031